MNVDQLLYNVVRPIAPEWFANRYRRQYILLSPLVSVLATPQGAVSKCGLHSIMDKHPGYGDLLKTVNAAGRKLAVVKCRDNFGAAWEAKQLWPDVLTIGAFTDFDGMAFDYAAFKKRALLNPWIDYWEVGNEINGEWAAQADKYIALLPKLKADGLRLAMFACASGTPQYPSIDPVPYAEIARACKFAKDGGFDALWAGHEYREGPDLIGRYRVLRDYLIDADAMIPFVITEYGPLEAGKIIASKISEPLPVAELMAYIAKNDQADMLDPWLKARALWTMGGWVNIEASFTKLGQYLATVPAPAVPPVVPSIDPLAYARTYYLLHGSQYTPAWCAPAFRADRMWDIGQSPHAGLDLGQHQTRRRIIAINPRLWPQPLATWAAQNYPAGYELIEVVCADVKDIEAAVNAKVGA